jgi:phage regulator Rha-like protein
MQDLIVKDLDGNLTVSSLTIAEVFGRRHSRVTKSIDLVNEKLIERGMLPCGLCFKINELANGKKERFFMLNEEQFLTVMPFIGGDKSFDGQIALVKEFKRLQKEAESKMSHLDTIRNLLLLDAPTEWVKLYPDSFYQAIMGLYGHEFDKSKNKPLYCGQVTRRWVYDIVLPEELQNEIDAKRKDERKHQWFQDENGRGALLAQISKVEMLARISTSRIDFESNCAKVFLSPPLQLTICG